MPERTPIPKTPLRFMIFISKPFWLYALGALVFATVGQLLNTGLPYVLKLIVDHVTAAATTEEVLVALQTWGGLYILMLLCAYASWRASGLIGVYWLARSKAYSFAMLYEYLVQHSHSYFINRFAGAVANKVSNASDGADGLLEQVTWHYYTTLLSLSGTGILLFLTDTRLGLIFVALVSVLFVLNLFLVRRRRPLVVAYAESSSVLKGVGVDLVTNITAVWHYAMRPFELRRLATYIDDRTVKDRARDLSQERGLLINNLFVVIAITGMIAVVYSGVAAGRMTIGDVVLVLSLLGFMSFNLIHIGNMLNGFIRTYGEIEEGLSEVLLPHDMPDRPRAQALSVPAGEIAWRDVTFDYGSNAIFNNLNLTIQPDQRIGIVGPSGAGKSTFVSLLLRQHDLDAGAIEIDGQNISAVTQDSLRRAIAVVPQEPMLFHRTIRENIAYGKPGATDEEVIRAAKLAQAHDFIEALPAGYETLVGERGVKLSGGQRQRIAIARAILKDAPILVLDEATSALDSESEVAIHKALHELMKGKTVIAIAHRLSTLREMDRIIVLENGKIVEDGSHDALLAYGGLYARLWQHQAGGFLQE